MKTLKNIAEVLFVYVCAAALSVAIFAVVLYGICPLAETKGCFAAEKDNSDYSASLVAEKQKNDLFSRCNRKTGLKSEFFAAIL